MTLAQQIARGARARGLDPRAVLAVASAEGLGSRRPGDRGTSFGPFQLHMGGALPRAHYGDAQRWSSSPQGLAYALNEIAKVARGQHGRQAIASIVRRFEKPRAPGAEIAKAWGRYGQVGGGPAPLSAAPPPLSRVSAAPDQQQVGLALLQAIRPGPEHGNFGNLYSLVDQRKQAEMQARTEAIRQAAQGHVAGAVANLQASGKPVTKGHLINELFYDPLGGIKHNRQIGAIGHHGDHVHVSLANGQAQLQAIAHAKQMGLHVGEERSSDVHPVHVKSSYHYRSYGPRFGNLREAADVSGSPAQMAAYYRWVKARYG